MRKALALLLLAAVTAGNAGCTSCVGKVRSLFRRGAPCGTTTVAPAQLGAPLVMQAPAPMMQAPPIVHAAPMQAAPVCVPCQPMCEPCGDVCGSCGDCGNCGCGQGWVSGSSGYFGGYVHEGGAGCAECNGGVMYDGAPYEGQVIEGGVVDRDYSGSSSRSEPTPSDRREDDPGPGGNRRGY